MLIHIGYHKTGTSWAQEEFFVDGMGFNKVLNHKEAHEYINCKRLFFFEPKELQRIVNSRFSEDKISVISSEILSGSPLVGGVNSYENAIKLKKAFPEAKILITLRNQEDFLCSIYLQYIKTGGCSSFADFKYHQRSSPSHNGWDLQHVLYSGLISHYIQLFGRDNVLVFQYENMKDKEAFSNKLYSFLGKEVLSFIPRDNNVNKSVRAGIVPYLRFINRFYKSYNNLSGFIPVRYGYRYVVLLAKFIGEFLGLDKSLSVDFTREEVELIADDNRKLKEIIGPLDAKYIV